MPPTATAVFVPLAAARPVETLLPPQKDRLGFLSLGGFGLPGLGRCGLVGRSSIHCLDGVGGGAVVPLSLEGVRRTARRAGRGCRDRSGIFIQRRLDDRATFKEEFVEGE